MGIFDLHWKGKSKAVSSSTNNQTPTSLNSRSQPPPPATPRWVRTPHWNEAEASNSSSSSNPAEIQPDIPGRSQKTREGRKASWKEKLTAESRKHECEHKITCGLNSRGCCACLDLRPLTTAYMIYKDGRGLVAEGNRWEHYCPGCQGYWAKRNGKGIPDPFSKSRQASRASSSGQEFVPPTNGTSSLKPEQRPEPQADSNELPPPPYSPSALSDVLDGWEILPRYVKEEG